jgi:hypothetical protein
VIGEERHAITENAARAKLLRQRAHAPIRPAVLLGELFARDTSGERGGGHQATFFALAASFSASRSFTSASITTLFNVRE